MYITAPENDLSVEQKQLIAKGLLIMAGTLNRQILIVQNDANLLNDCKNAGVDLGRWIPAAMGQADRLRTTAITVLVDIMTSQYADKSGLSGVEVAKICFDTFDQLADKLAHMSDSDAAFALIQAALDKAFSDVS